MVVGYSRDTVGKGRRVEGPWSAVGVSMRRTKPGRSYWKDGAGSRPGRGCEACRWAEGSSGPHQNPFSARRCWIPPRPCQYL